MTVRRKTLLIIAITCFGLVVVSYGASRSFLLGGFIKLAQTSAEEDVQRVLNALDQDLAAIDRFTYDRASIDETYNAMSDPSPEFIHTLPGKNASGSTRTRRFNFMLLINASWKVIASRSHDLVTKQVIEVPESLKAHISETDPLIQSAKTKGTLNGVLLLPEGPLLIVARPIVVPNTKGPVRGFLLSARFLEPPGDLTGLEKTTNFSLSIHRIDEESLPNDFSDARQHLSAQSKFTCVLSMTPFWAAMPCLRTFTQSRH